MASCPFCGAQVPEDLVTYGGNCPKCFAEIPGEEAPTDPGAEVRAIQVAQDRRGTRLKALIGFSMMVGLVGCAGVTALGVLLWPSPEVAILEFDELDMGGMEFVAVDHVPEEGEEVEKPAETVKQVNSTPKPTVAKTPTKEPGGNSLEGFKQKTDLNLAKADLTPASNLKGTRDGSRRPSSDGGQADVGPAKLNVNTKVNGASKNAFDFDQGNVDLRRKRVLTDEAEIKSTMSARMRTLVRELNWCYERSLKQDSGLQGRWTIAFTVTKVGRVRSASAKGLSKSSPEFEACMVGKMNRWTGFWPMTKDRPVSRNLRFRPR